MDKTLRRQIGQMIIAGFPSPEADDQARMMAEDYQVDNFILFARNMQNARQTARLCGQLSRLAYDATGLAPFIAADQEGGMVSRITEGAALFPGAMALAAGATLEQARQVGKNCGQILRAVGVNVNFAPVLDVNIEPLNPIIGVRSYGDDPQAVADMGCAVLEGMAEGGVLATVKHYPGHGNVQTDSHLALPVNDADPEVLEKTEFFPFQEAFRRGVPALMSCHIRFPKLDEELPATLSPAIITGLLRGKQGFGGLVFTDCMEMEAIRANWGIAQGAVLAVAAGCDILCISHHAECVKEAIEAIEQAVAEGRIPRSRIQESYDRILSAKKGLGLLEPQQIFQEEALKVIHDPEKLALHRQASQSSVTLISDKGGLEALKKAERPLILAPISLASTGAEDKERGGISFARAAGEALGWDWREIPMNPTGEEIAAIAQQARDRDGLLLGLYNARFRTGQQELLEALKALGLPLTVMLMGGPYDAAWTKGADAVICAYEYTALSTASAAEALRSGRFPGKLPIKLSPGETL